MATKAELESELEALKKEMAEKTAKAVAAADSGTDSAADTIRKASETARAAAQGGKESLIEFLRSHGIDGDNLDIETLWQQMSDEAGDIARKQPVLTGVAIFALGFVLGRVSK